MIDVYLIKKRNVPELFSRTQEELELISKNFIDGRIQFLKVYHKVTRYKNSTLSRDLNKIILKGEQPIIMLGYVGFEIPRFFDDNVIDKFLINNNLGMMGFRIMDENGTVIDAGIDNPLKAMPIWRCFNETFPAQEAKTEDVNVYIDGNFVIIKRDTFESVKGFDEEYELMWNIDLSFRIGQLRRGILYYPMEICHDNYFERRLDVLEKMYAKDRKTFTSKFIKKLSDGIVVEGSKINGNK